MARARGRVFEATVGDRELADFAARRTRILVATVGLFAEGVNIRGTSCIVYAAGMRSRTRILQAVGRGMRLAPGKDVCIYGDFIDEDPLGRFLAHSRRRLQVLDEAGFAVPDDLPPEILAVRAVDLAAPGAATLRWGDGAAPLQGRLPDLFLTHGQVRFTARIVERSDRLRYRLQKHGLL